MFNLGVPSASLRDRRRPVGNSRRASPLAVHPPWAGKSGPTGRRFVALPDFRLRVKGGIVLAFSEKTALGSGSRLGAHGVARKPACPLTTQYRILLYGHGWRKPTTKAPAIRWHSESGSRSADPVRNGADDYRSYRAALGGRALTRAASVASRNCLPTSWQARHNCEASLSPLCARAGVRLDSWTARRAWHRIAEAPQAAFRSAVSSSSPCQPLTFAWYIIRKSRSERKSINVEW